jgi:hypothetical protein
MFGISEPCGCGCAVRFLVVNARNGPPGQTLANAQVTVQSSPYAYGVTDEDGYVTFIGLEPGTYAVQVDPYYEEWTGEGDPPEDWPEPIAGWTTLGVEVECGGTYTITQQCSCTSVLDAPDTVTATLTSNSGKPDIVITLTRTTYCTYVAPCQSHQWASNFGLNLYLTRSVGTGLIDAQLWAIAYFAQCTGPSGGGINCTLLNASCDPLLLSYNSGQFLFLPLLYYNRITITV